MLRRHKLREINVQILLSPYFSPLPNLLSQQLRHFKELGIEVEQDLVVCELNVPAVKQLQSGVLSFASDVGSWSVVNSEVKFFALWNVVEELSERLVVYFEADDSIFESNDESISFLDLGLGEDVSVRFFISSFGHCLSICGTKLPIVRVSVVCFMIWIF